MGVLVPILEGLTDGQGNLDFFASDFLSAAIAFPEDDQLQEQYLAALALKLVVMHRETDHYETLLVSAQDLLPAMLEAPPLSKLVRLAGQGIGRGWIAGRLLELLVRAEVHHPELQATVSKGIYALSQVYGDAKAGGGSYLYVSERTLWSNWRRYKRVAHFHALIQMALMGSEATGEQSTLCTPEDFTVPAREDLPAFVARAEWLRGFSEEHRLVRRDELFQAPPDLELPEVAVWVPVLDEDELEALTLYRPPHSKT